MKSSVLFFSFIYCNIGFSSENISVFEAYDLYRESSGRVANLFFAFSPEYFFLFFFCFRHDDVPGSNAVMGGAGCLERQPLWGVEAINEVSLVGGSVSGWVGRCDQVILKVVEDTSGACRSCGRVSCCVSPDPGEVDGGGEARCGGRWIVAGEAGTGRRRVSCSALFMEKSCGHSLRTRGDQLVTQDVPVDGRSGDHTCWCCFSSSVAESATECTQGKK